MAYNGKRILNHVAFDMYLEEMDIISPEQSATRIAREINECYAQREREDVARIERETELAWEVFNAMEEEEEVTLEWMESCELEFWDKTLEDEEEFDDELYVWAEILEKVRENAISSENIQKKNIRARRRKQEARHKSKMRRNAKSAMQNMQKRVSEDCKNMTRCKRRGGRWVLMPKSLSIQADKLWKKAAKMKLVEPDPFG